MNNKTYEQLWEMVDNAETKEDIIKADTIIKGNTNIDSREYNNLQNGLYRQLKMIESRA